MFRRPDVDGALAELETVFATKHLAELTPEAVDALLGARRVRPDRIPDQLLSLYRKALGFCLKDDELSNDDEEALKRLALVLGLERTSVEGTRNELIDARYRERLGAALTDRFLSDDEKKALETLAEKLRIPKAHLDSIRQEMLGNVMKERFHQAIADRRLSPEEDQHLAKVAENLGVNVSYDGEMQRLADRFRLLWRIEQGELPVISAPILLQKGESCHWSMMDVSLHELRTVTTRIGYSGPTARIRIMKGVYWRVGSLGVNRSSQDVLKLLDIGTLYLTSKRLLFDGAKKTTNIPLRRIINFAIYEDGIKIEKDSGKDQVFQFTNSDTEMLGALLNGALGR
jgi:hypothetical protein